MRSGGKLLTLNATIILCISILMYNVPYHYLAMSLLAVALFYLLFWIVVPVIIHSKIILKRQEVWLIFIPNYVVIAILFILGIISHVGFIFNALSTATLFSAIFLPLIVELIMKVDVI
ncbi:hypothetical protein [Bacillus solimangrovi]|uniref:Uncharacterized protein n=1 Tax=Bacillus solimangrovi TaxID=1305675 RepID=A0A1E5LKC9_9BACI|nr:hypothetical protein [Bacillus solimangrovi]OEH94549.1 hypothetical protein BFG57_07730 [Bacillus solimangrovi]